MLCQPSCWGGGGSISYTNDIGFLWIMLSVLSPITSLAPANTKLNVSISCTITNINSSQLEETEIMMLCANYDSY